MLPDERSERARNFVPVSYVGQTERMSARQAGTGGSLYRDRWIECTEWELRVRGYYFPWGTKRIPYSSIRSIRRVSMGFFTGKARIWGTSNFGYWASFDPRRPRKNFGLVLDLGRNVKPFITPDDASDVEAIVRQRANLSPGEGRGSQSPLV